MRIVAANCHRRQSTAADSDHDFDFIAVGQHFFAMAAARNDFAVALERNTLAGEFELLQQLPAIEWLFEAAAFAVYGQCDQEQSSAIRWIKWTPAVRAAQ